MNTFHMSHAYTPHSPGVTPPLEITNQSVQFLNCSSWRLKRWIALSVLMHVFFLSKDRLDKLNKVYLNSSISLKLFSLQVQPGSSFIDPVLLQEET